GHPGFRHDDRRIEFGIKTWGLGRVLQWTAHYCSGYFLLCAYFGLCSGLCSRTEESPGYALFSADRRSRPGCALRGFKLAARVAEVFTKAGSLDGAFQGRHGISHDGCCSVAMQPCESSLRRTRLVAGDVPHLRGRGRLDFWRIRPTWKQA